MSRRERLKGTTGKRNRANASSPAERAPSVVVELSREDVQTLAALAHFYDRSLRPVRLFIRITSGRDMRRRIRFVAEESNWLEQFARAAQDEMAAAGAQSHGVRLTVRSLIAFWGRVLASLNTPRSRRKLSEAQIEERERLALKLEEAAARLAGRDRAALHRELDTRRPVEAGWIRERLESNG